MAVRDRRKLAQPVPSREIPEAVERYSEGPRIYEQWDKVSPQFQGIHG